MALCYTLIIIDNGRGMHTVQGTDRPARPGIGIRGIRVRLHRHGGRLRITQAARRNQNSCCAATRRSPEVIEINVATAVLCWKRA